MVITFDRPIAVSAIELRPGRVRRGLSHRSCASAPPIPARRPGCVWEGGTRGAEAAALLDDRDATRREDRAGGAIAGAVNSLLTITEGDSAFWWSVAELKVFGR